MIIFLIILIIIFLYNIKINLNGFNNDYLNRKNTTIVNGFFVIMVFFSHFMPYTYCTNEIDISLIRVTLCIGQLMVTTFLFYSGYGIYEKIKKNKEEYINKFLKKRFLPTLINFDIAVLLYLLLSFILKVHFSKKTIMLSLIGLESLGNSDWYMFDIFLMYLILLICFKLNKNRKNNNFSLVLITIITIIFVFIINKFKDNYWCDTLLCFPAGMWYSYFKDKIDKFVMKNNLSYFLTLIVFILLFILLYDYRMNIYANNCLSIVFVCIINLNLMKITLGSKPLLIIGQNVFWIYILQRLPMIVLQSKLNIYAYFILCFLITIILTYIMKKIINYITNKLHAI